MNKSTTNELILRVQFPIDQVIEADIFASWNWFQQPVQIPRSTPISEWKFTVLSYDTRYLGKSPRRSVKNYRKHFRCNHVRISHINQIHFIETALSRKFRVASIETWFRENSDACLYSRRVLRFVQFWYRWKMQLDGFSILLWFGSLLIDKD